MSLHLMIENCGTFDYKSVTMLGVGDSRRSDNPAVGGMFSSGSKMSLALLLRQGLNPIIYIGCVKLEFFSKPITVRAVDGRSHDYAQVCVRLSGTTDEGKQLNRVEELGFTLELGELDWRAQSMAFREFVSNGIDASIKLGTENTPLTIKTVSDESVRAKSGYTRVFLPLTPEIQQAYNNLNKTFLHFANSDLLGNSVLEKAGRNQIENNKSACLYRKGVLVCEIEGPPSLFDYNIDDIEIDECRNVNKYTAKSQIGKTLAAADPTVLTRVIETLVNAVDEDKYLEHGLDVDWNLSFGSGEDRDKFKQCFAAAFGDDAVIISADIGVDNFNKIVKKGYRPIVVSAHQWYSALTKAGVRRGTDLLTEGEKRNRQIFDLTPEANKLVKRVWNYLYDANMVGEKSLPDVKLFDELVEGGEKRLGFVENETVYLHRDNVGNTTDFKVTVLEELGHYLTGATDGSRDMQEFLGKFAISMAERT